MPLDVDDDDPERGAGNRRMRFEEPYQPWWKPTGRLGRAAWVAAACMVLGGVAWAFHASKSYLEHDGRFRIAGASNIEASGLSVLTRADLLPVFGEDIGRNVFYVPLAERRRELEQLPWIKQATVMRVLPDQLRVSVVERQPVAFARHGNQFGLVDAEGVLLTMPVAMMTQRHYSFPVLTGIDDHDSPDARKQRMDLYLRMQQELTANGAHGLDNISEIDLTDPENARVLMQAQGSDILADFGNSNFEQRFQRYQANIKDWRQQYPDLAEVDLRYDTQVVLEMKHAAQPSVPATPAAPAKPKAETAANAHGKAAPSSHATLKRTAASKSPGKHSSSHARSAKSHHATVKHAHHRAATRHKTSRQTHRQNQEARAVRAITEQGQ
ncbi:MAG TPA: FtsQ-type POTRA domain-containing protein [Terracidiphilus sp.]|nr:FtsQ-type POTRA domain-containing protein [Terracidiphilus sp.]